MIKKYLSFSLVCLLLLTANFSLISAQTNIDKTASSIAKIKTKIIKRQSRDDNRASIKLANGTTLKGYVSQAGGDSFTLTDVKTKQKTTVLYADVAQVSGGFPNSAKIVILSGVAVAGVILAAIVYQLYNH